MCCDCCSVTQQKFWVFGLAILFTSIGLVAVLWWPAYIEDFIYKSLPLSACSRIYDKWYELPVPIYLYMYLFNWTNPEEVRMAGVKPHFEQLGPYVFREERVKEDITWHKNKTVTFYNQRFWHHEPELSGGSLDDLITCPHLPSIAASNIVRDYPAAFKLGFSTVMNANGGALYQTHTAMEWLFEGFYDQFLDFAMQQNSSLTGKVDSNEFAWFLNRNGSKEFEGTFTIHTGQGDLRQMGDLKMWNGKNHTGFYEGECGRINGSTSELWVPNRGPDEYITIFITDTCRIINLVPNKEKVTLEGIQGVKYETKADTFDNGQLNPDMQCYCPTERQPDNCPATGATDLGPCTEGAPMYMSHANFMYADPSYADTISGMEPDYDRDGFFIIMEPKLGIPLQVNAAVQISLHIQSDPYISILRGIPDFYAPLFITASRARINKQLAKEVKLALNLPNIGLNVGIALVCLGSVMIAVGVMLTFTHRWRGEQKQINDAKNQ